MMPSSSVHTDQSFAHYLHMLSRETEILGQEITLLCSGMSGQRFNWKPAPASWSIGQCVQHLVVFNTLYFASIEQSVEKARRKYTARSLKSAQGTYKAGTIGGFLIRMMYPGALKVRTPQAFQPSHSDIPHTALRDFSSAQQQLAGILRKCADINLNRTRVASPAAGLLRFRLGDILTILVRHERRHFDQMKRLAAHPLFPRD